MKIGMLHGPMALLAGFKLIFHRGIRLYAILPFVLCLITLLVGFISLWRWLDQQIYSWISWLPEWMLSWFGNLIWGSLMLFWLLLSSFFFASLAGLLASPFNGLLSDATRQHLGQQLPDNFKWSELLPLIGKSLTREWHKIVYMAPRIALLLILSGLSWFIPPLGLIVSVLWLLLGGWFLALQYLDYPADNEGLDLSQTLAIMRHRRLAVLAFGLSCYLLVLIPGLNLLLLPAAVCGATSLWLRLTKL